jgi:hypothetical protein
MVDAITEKKKYSWATVEFLFLAALSGGSAGVPEPGRPATPEPDLAALSRPNVRIDRSGACHPHSAAGL